MSKIYSVYNSFKHYVESKPAQWVVFTHLIFIVSFYHKVVFNANQVFLWINNDGLKNYYMFTYYVKHNVKWFMHEGMPYNFGEYFLLSDSHPLLAIVYRVMSNLFPFMDDYAVGFLNLCMLFTPLITSYFIFKILQHYKIISTIAIPTSIGITLLSSQYLSVIFGHYALTYSFFIPISIWQIIRYSSSNNRKILLYNGLILFVSFFTHMYHGVMLVALQLAFSLLCIIGYRNKYKQYLLLAGSTFLVLLSVFVLIKLDPYSDRAVINMNLDHTGNVLTTFVANNAGYLAMFKGMVDLSQFNQYSWSRIGTYIGWSSIFFIVILILRTIKGFLIKGVKGGLSWSDWSLLLSSVLLLLFSFGYPSKIDGGMLFDHFPTIYQIIALCRFGFPFFYVVGILGIVYFYRIINNRVLQLSIGIFLSVLFIVESFPMHSQIRNAIGHRPNMFNEEIFDEHYHYQDWNINAGSFDAILPLPIYVFYGVPFIRNSTLASEEFSMASSMRTGLPMNTVYLSRASIGNSEITLDLVEDKNRKEVQDLYQDKKLLVCYTKEELRQPERILLNHLQDTVFQNKNILIFSMNCNDWLSASLD